MKAKRDDRVFLVRMWREDGSEREAWRGSVHDVVAGRRLYLTTPREIADFITLALRERPTEDSGT